VGPRADLDAVVTRGGHRTPVVKTLEAKSVVDWIGLIEVSWTRRRAFNYSLSRWTTEACRRLCIVRLTSRHWKQMALKTVTCDGGRYISVLEPSNRHRKDNAGKHLPGSAKGGW